MLIPHLETRTIRFRPYTSADIEETYGLTLRVGLESMPTIDMLEERVESASPGYLTSFMVELRRTGEVVGACSLKGPETAGHMFVAIYTDVGKTSYGVGAEAMTLLVNYAFANWEDVRKVYFVTTDASIERFETALFHMPREATLRDHAYFQGRFWDHYWYAIYREPWVRQVTPYVNRLATGERRPRRAKRRV